MRIGLSSVTRAICQIPFGHGLLYHHYSFLHPVNHVDGYADRSTSLHPRQGANWSLPEWSRHSAIVFFTHLHFQYIETVDSSLGFSITSWVSIPMVKGYREPQWDQPVHFIPGAPRILPTKSCRAISTAAFAAVLCMAIPST